MIELYEPMDEKGKPKSEFDRVNSEFWASIILFLISPFVFWGTFLYCLIKDKFK